MSTGRPSPGRARDPPSGEYLDTLERMDEAGLGVQPARRYRSSSPGRIRPHEWTRRPQRTCLLCLRRQLPDRPEGGDELLDAEATRAIRQAEVGAARTTIERTRLVSSGSVLERLAADSALRVSAGRCWGGWSTSARSSRTFLVFDKSARDDGTSERGDFQLAIRKPISTKRLSSRGKVLTSTGTLVERRSNAAVSRQQV